MKNYCTVFLLIVLSACNADQNLRMTPISSNDSELFVLRRSKDSVLLFFPTTYLIQNRSLNTMNLSSVRTNSKIQNGNLAYSFNDNGEPLFSTGKLV